MARRLLFLNGLATFGLVLNHAASWVFIGMFWWTHRYRDVAVPNFDQLGSAEYYFLRVVEQLVAFTVPSFLFVSAFFMAFVAGREPLVARWANAEKRLRTLLVPYLLWSTLLLLERYSMGQRYAPAGYLRIYLTGRAAEPYYYIPLLCQYLLLAPLLIECAKRNWKVLLAVTALVQLTAQGLRYPMYLGAASPALQAVVAATPGWFFPGKVFWFASGLVVGLHLETFQRCALRYRWHCAAVGALLLPLGVLEWEILRGGGPTEWIAYYDTALDSLYAAMIIVVVIAFGARWSAFTERVEEVGRRSYGVYLVHSLVLVYGARGVYAILPRMLEHGVLFFVFLVVTGLGVPLVAMNVLRNSRLRGAYRYVFG